MKMPLTLFIVLLFAAKKNLNFGVMLRFRPRHSWLHLVRNTTTTRLPLHFSINHKNQQKEEEIEEEMEEQEV